jgi:transposase
MACAVHVVSLARRPMPRYKHIDTQPKLVPIDLSRQLLPGTFEHAVNYLLDHAVDLSGFDARFRNEATGAPAYPPGMLLKVVLTAYAHGIISSRGIERACQEHVIFIALCGDHAPHFTTIAHFIRTLGDEIARIFGAVVAVCDQQGLIGREMFAIDGVKLPSNASKRRSGTRADFAQQAEKYETLARQLLARHEATDDAVIEPSVLAHEHRRRQRLEDDAAQLRAWLADHPTDRRGPTGGLRQSNRTDNDSAKMGTGKGVLQGYTGAAAVDARHQIILDAQAHGTGSEQEVLLPVVDALRSRALLGSTTLITADAGYHSERNLAALAERQVDALIADAEMRQRDTRFATQERHRAMKEPLHDKSEGASSRELPLYRPSDFMYDPAARTCVCPAGKSLYRKGQSNMTRGYVAEHFRGAKRDCMPCAHRARCLRHPDRTPTRQVAFYRDSPGPGPNPHTRRMKERIDTPAGRAQYAARFGTVEPVFANLCYNKGLARFTLRGRAKVDGQWKLFCLVHNIEKLAHHGYAS